MLLLLEIVFFIFIFSSIILLIRGRIFNIRFSVLILFACILTLGAIISEISISGNPIVNGISSFLFALSISFFCFIFLFFNLFFIAEKTQRIFFGIRVEDFLRANHEIVEIRPFLLILGIIISCSNKEKDLEKRNNTLNIISNTIQKKPINIIGKVTLIIIILFFLLLLVLIIKLSGLIM
jgi:hypothetical protein